MGGTPSAEEAGKRMRKEVLAFLKTTSYLRFDPALAKTQRAQHDGGEVVLGVRAQALCYAARVVDGASKGKMKRLGMSAMEPHMVKGRLNLSTLAFQEGAHADVPMHLMASAVFAGATAPTKTAFIEFFYGWTDHRENALVGPATHFHSYTWQETWQGTLRALDSLEHSDRDNMFVWMDIFCQNQHDTSNVMETFSRAIAQVQTLIFSVPNLVKAQALSRTWCVFELASAVRGNRNIMLISENMNKKDVLKSLEIDESKLCRDIRDCEAKYESDRTMVLEMVEKTIPGGADAVNRSVRERFMPLFYERLMLSACLEGVLPAVNLALSKGVDPNGKAMTWTMLGAAAFQGHQDVVERLLAAGANVNGHSNGRTALVNAAQKNRIAIAKILIAAGAKVKLKDIPFSEQSDSDAMHMARTCEHREMVSVLRSARI